MLQWFKSCEQFVVLLDQNQEMHMITLWRVIFLGIQHMLFSWMHQSFNDTKNQDLQHLEESQCYMSPILLHCSPIPICWFASIRDLTRCSLHSSTAKKGGEPEREIPGLVLPPPFSTIKVEEVRLSLSYSVFPKAPTAVCIVLQK